MPHPVEPSIWNIPVATVGGGSCTLERYRGRVLLIVNVASRCRATPQYAGLEALYRRHRDAGLVVLGFPSNQFRQELGTDAAITEFCVRTYDVTFPVFARVDVNGSAAHPLFRLLKSRRKGILGTGAIKWNFTKFLVDRQGAVVGRFSPLHTPERLEPHVVALLGSMAGET